MFKAAALTRQYDIENSAGFDPKRDKVVVLEVSDLATIKTQVAENVQALSPTYGPTVEFSIWSHSALAGPTGTSPTSEDPIDGKQMTMSGWGKIDFNWGSNARARFMGCRAGLDPEGPQQAFTTQISGLQNMKDVSVWGQPNFSYPSQTADTRNTTIAQAAGNYLPLVRPAMDSDASTTAQVFKTYLVASPNNTWNSIVSITLGGSAEKMRVSKNGKEVGTSYQPGTKD